MRGLYNKIYHLENGDIIEIPELGESKKLRKDRKKVKFVSKLKRKFVSKLRR